MGINKTVVLGALPSNVWCVYADGYRKAAVILIENVKESYDVNTVCFPIIALARQYIELTTKEIISYGQYLEDHQVKQGTHDISNLWACAKSYLKKHIKDATHSDIKLIDDFIEELNKIDPTSESSRYPYIKSKNKPSGSQRSFSSDHIWIDLDVLNEKLSAIKEKFEMITNSLSILVDFEMEFRMEMRNELVGEFNP